MAIHCLVRVHWDALGGGQLGEFFGRTQCLKGYWWVNRERERERERERANNSTEDVTEKALISESYDNLSFDIPTISLETNNSNDVFELHNFRSFVVGGKKCLFLLESNPSVGYLVTQELLWQRKWNKNAFGKFKKTYQFSFDLERDYNVTSMFIDPPREIHVNVSFYNELQKMSKRKFHKDRPFMVQKTRLAPDNHIVFQLSFDHKRVHLFPLYTRFLIESNVTDYDAFLTNLGRDLNTMNAFLNDRKYSILSYDFQFIVDNTGHIHHLDLDRAFEHRDRHVRIAVIFFEAVQNNFEAAVKELKQNQTYETTDGVE